MSEHLIVYFHAILSKTVNALKLTAKLSLLTYIMEKKNKKKMQQKLSKTLSILFLDCLAFNKMLILFIRQSNSVMQLKKTDSALVNLIAP